MDIIEEKKPNILSYIIAVVVVILSVIPFIANYKFNDNHLNWLNHDYCKNLMTSTELNSVFMTEGGDNQVFGSLYFTYAEKLRPDITPYDQKGNIFKRIYGDMRYITPDILSHRQDLVDSNIFDGQEPFYEDIRDPADPYFIPYWMGERPVYLTWKRPNPETLGDFYYKRYGIMYKALDIEYRLVDYLETKRSITVSHAKDMFETWLDRDLTYDYVNEKIDLMVDGGYINQTGTTLTFVEGFEAPHLEEEEDYFDHFLLRWHEAPNAQYWDFLTREIIVNYDYQMGEIHREEMLDLEEIKSNESREEIIANIDEEIAEHWKKAIDYYNDALYYGGDSISILHNVSVVYLNTTKEGPYGEDLKDEAHKLLTKALNLYKSSWGTYSVMFMHLINQMLDNPGNDQEYLEEINVWFDQLKEQMELYQSAQGSYTNHAQWPNFAGIESYVAQFEQMSGATLMQNVEQLSNEIEETPNAVDLQNAVNTITALYSRGLTFAYSDYTDMADYFYETLLVLKKSESSYLQWALNYIAIPLQNYEDVYYIGRRLEAIGQAPATYDYYLQMGQATYFLGYNTEAMRYLNLYLETIKEDRMAQLNNSATINEVKTVLQQLSNQ